MVGVTSKDHLARSNMKCFASLVIFALACVAYAAPTTEHKLLSESSGQFVKVDPTTGTVTADASQDGKRVCMKLAARFIVLCQKYLQH